ncbi:MAG: hypothetical protein ABH950_02210, partial [Candidatus Altiarchaeota archaeon]
PGGRRVEGAKKTFVDRLYNIVKLHENSDFSLLDVDEKKLKALVVKELESGDRFFLADDSPEYRKRFLDAKERGSAASYMVEFTRLLFEDMASSSWKVSWADEEAFQGLKRKFGFVLWAIAESTTGETRRSMRLDKEPLTEASTEEASRRLTLTKELVLRLNEKDFSLKVTSPITGADEVRSGLRGKKRRLIYDIMVEALEEHIPDQGDRNEAFNSVLEGMQRPSLQETATMAAVMTRLTPALAKASCDESGSFDLAAFRSMLDSSLNLGEKCEPTKLQPWVYENSLPKLLKGLEDFPQPVRRGIMERLEGLGAINNPDQLSHFIGNVVERVLKPLKESGFEDPLRALDIIKDTANRIEGFEEDKGIKTDLHGIQRSLFSPPEVTRKMLVQNFLLEAVPSALKNSAVEERPKKRHTRLVDKARAMGRRLGKRITTRSQTDKVLIGDEEKLKGFLDATVDQVFLGAESSEVITSVAENIVPIIMEHSSGDPKLCGAALRSFMEGTRKIQTTNNMEFCNSAGKEMVRLSIKEGKDAGKVDPEKLSQLFNSIDPSRGVDSKEEQLYLIDFVPQALSASGGEPKALAQLCHATTKARGESLSNVNSVLYWKKLTRTLLRHFPEPEQFKAALNHVGGILQPLH